MWLLLVYKVPNEPSKNRVYVWRKLKGLGAILLHDAIWVLPTNERTREKLQWLATEIKDMSGEATLWEAQQVFTGQDGDLMRQFTEQVDAQYQAVLDALERDDADLAAISKQYQQARSQDYFQSELGKQVHLVLVKRRDNKEL